MKTLQSNFLQRMLLGLGLVASGTLMAQTVVINVSINQPSPLRATAADSLSYNLCEGDSLTLGGNPTALGGTAPYAYAWSPGTGLSSTTVSNPIAFPAGSTTYSLQVTDANNCTDQGTVTVDVFNTPISAFNFNSNGLTVDFTDQTSGTVTGWSWDFGDGNTSTAQNPTHTYAGPGQYTVCLTAWNGPCGQESCIVLTVLVGIDQPLPFAQFQANPNPFGTATMLSYDLMEEGFARLEVYDLQGRLLSVLTDGPTTVGQQRVPFDPSEFGGGAGVYLVRLTTTTSIGVSRASIRVIQL